MVAARRIPLPFERRVGRASVGDQDRRFLEVVRQFLAVGIEDHLELPGAGGQIARSDFYGDCRLAARLGG